MLDIHERPSLTIERVTNNRHIVFTQKNFCTLFDGQVPAAKHDVNPYTIAHSCSRGEVNLPERGGEWPSSASSRKPVSN